MIKTEIIGTCSRCGKEIEASSELIFAQGGEYIDWVFEERRKKCRRLKKINRKGESRKWEG